MLMVTMMMMPMGWTGSVGETHGTEQRYTDDRVRHTAVILGTERSGYTLYMGGWVNSDNEELSADMTSALYMAYDVKDT